MYLKTDKIVVTVGDVTMRSYKTAVGPQYQLDPTAVVGWQDGVDIRRSFTPRQIRAGDFLEAGRHASRYISFSGTAIAANAQDLLVMRDNFAGMVLPKNYETLTVTDSGSTRSATVTIGGKTSWVRQLDNVAAFKIDFYAPDPNIYGPTRTITLGGSAGLGAPLGGGLDLPLSYPIDYGTAVALQSQYVYNNGNNEAWPSFKITGDYPGGFAITDNLGSFITYSGMVTMKSPVIIDSSGGYATQDGNDRSTFLSRRDWFSIQPGQTLQPSFIPVQNTNGWCDIIFRDTWI
jgi:hypothetical protein